MTNMKSHGLSIDTKIDDLGWPWTAVRSKFIGFSRDFAILAGSNVIVFDHQTALHHRFILSQVHHRSYQLVLPYFKGNFSSDCLGKIFHRL